jgi:hypothetical protein
MRRILYLPLVTLGHIDLSANKNKTWEAHHRSFEPVSLAARSMMICDKQQVGE